jgi:hypothetical protein
METFLRDIRDGLRTLTKTPGFTAVAVLTLALGIGANIAIFSVINAVLLHPLPVRDAQRIVMLHDQFPSWDMPRTSVSALQVVELARRTDLFESSGAMQALDLNLTDRDHSSRLQAMEVTAGFMTVLGVRMAFSRPGKPTDNAFVESFNGTFRAECLNAHWFSSLTEAQRIVETWRGEYNESRPHRALGEKTPNEFAKEIAASRNFLGSPTAENSL